MARLDPPPIRTQHATGYWFTPPWERWIAALRRAVEAFGTMADQDADAVAITGGDIDADNLSSGGLLIGQSEDLTLDSGGSITPTAWHATITPFSGTSDTCSEISTANARSGDRLILTVTSGNTVTIDPSGSTTLKMDAAKTLDSRFDTIQFLNYGTTWRLVSFQNNA